MTYEYKVSVDGTLREYLTRSKKLSRQDALAEIVDNAFDAGATHVVVDVGNDNLVVRDNGRGCDDFDKIMTLNGSNEDGGKKTGRYGQGLKVAAMRLGDTLRIDSSTKSGRLQAVCHWDEMRPETVANRGPGPRTGTKITIGRMERRMTDAAIAKMAAHFSWTYRTALEEGCSIVLNGEKLRAAPLPRFAESKSEVIQFEDGRLAKVVAGILDDSDYDPGIEVFYKIRHVRRYDPPSGTGSFAALVTLLDAPGSRVHAEGTWTLGLHKTDIADQAQERGLKEAIEHRFAKLIAKAKAEPIDIGLSFLRSGSRVAVKRSNEGAPIDRSRRGTKSGSRSKGELGGPTSARGGIRIIRTSLTSGKIGEARSGGEVALNDNHPYIDQLFRAKGTDVGDASIAFVAALLIGEQTVGVSDEDRNGQRLLTKVGALDVDDSERIHTVASKLITHFLETRSQSKETRKSQRLPNGKTNNAAVEAIS